MTRDEAINDLKTLKDFFIEQSDATPLCLDYAIEALERKRGKWIVVPDNIGDFQKAGYRWVKCNKCTNQVKIRLDSPLYDFCPYCGSDMRERREDE